MEEITEEEEEEEKEEETAVCYKGSMYGSVRRKLNLPIQPNKILALKFFGLPR